MSWSIGYDRSWQRDIGYGVPAFCDHPRCDAEIDRGLSYVCGGEPYGGERGCGLYFCGQHLDLSSLCARCRHRKPAFAATPDHPQWIAHKLHDESWAAWRAAHSDDVSDMSRRKTESRETFTKVAPSHRPDSEPTDQ